MTPQQKQQGAVTRPLSVQAMKLALWIQQEREKREAEASKNETPAKQG